MVHKNIARFKKVAARKRSAAAHRRAIRRTVPVFRFGRGDYLKFASGSL